MRIRVLSDLHVDFGYEVSRLQLVDVIPKKSGTAHVGMPQR